MKRRGLCTTWLLLAGGLLLASGQAGCGAPAAGDRLAWKLPFGSAQSSSGQSSSAATRADGGGGEPNSPRGSYLLELAKGRNLEQAGNWDEARGVYKRLIASHPQRSEAYHRLGVVADRQRRHDEAQRLYTQALQRNPTDAELFNDLGYCFYLQGKLTKAESALQKATVLEPDNARYRNNLGMVLGQQQRYDEAFAEFAEAGNESDAYYNLAFVYASQDQHDKAKACFQQALRVNPTHEQAREALA
ncbi:MAG: tetratricopeptide repeat protein, partial [Pirellulaceae bacterium]|nr:tetratricopeptide repeat protein [Pirellulaceae bacterium]